MIPNSASAHQRIGFCFHCHEMKELGRRANGKPAKLCHSCMAADKQRRDATYRDHEILLASQAAEILELKTKLAAAEAEIKELRSVFAALKSSLELYC